MSLPALFELVHYTALAVAGLAQVAQWAWGGTGGAVAEPELPWGIPIEEIP